MTDTTTLAAATFAALGEPTRLRIVELLRDGPLSVGVIADRLGVRQPQISKHLRILGGSDLVAVEARHRHRIYRLCAEPFHAVAEWTESFEALWQTRLDSLGAFLQTPQPKGSPNDQAD